MCDAYANVVKYHALLSSLEPTTYFLRLTFRATFLETLNGYGGKESVEICRYKFYQEMIER